jgi:hypothetical protein
MQREDAITFRDLIGKLGAPRGANATSADGSGAYQLHRLIVSYGYRHQGVRLDGRDYGRLLAEAKEQARRFVRGERRQTCWDGLVLKYQY